MTRSEQLAFNEGVATVIALAGQAARAMEPKLIEKPTRYNFAHAALMAIVEEAVALMMPVDPPPDTQGSASTPIPPSPIPNNQGAAEAARAYA